MHAHTQDCVVRLGTGVNREASRFSFKGCWFHRRMEGPDCNYKPFINNSTPTNRSLRSGVVGVGSCVHMNRSVA